MFLFIFTDENSIIMLKGIKNKEKQLTVMSNNRQLTEDNLPSFSYGHDTIWVKLEKSDIHPVCTVIRLQLKELLQLYYGLGLHPLVADYA